MAIIEGEPRRSSPKEMNPTLSKLKRTVFDTGFGGAGGAVVGGIVGMVLMGPMARHYSLTRAQFVRMAARDYSAVGAAIFGTKSIMRGIRGKDDLSPEYGIESIIRGFRGKDDLTSEYVIESIMRGIRGIRGKDDLTSDLVSASGGGLAFSFARKGFKVRPAHALSWAAAFAVAAGTMYKVDETNRLRKAQDAFYKEARAMLSKLGLEEYEKNFKRGHLTDPTLPLLTEWDLKEVDIPSGPRLLILDHIKRYHKMVNRK